MAQDIARSEGAVKAPGAPPQNPYIVNFLKVLVEKKGEKHDPEGLEKLLDDMYRMFEFMLGKNMVNALPEGVRKEYLSICEDLSQLSYKKIGEVFDKNVQDYERVMKDTMQEFAEIYLKNRRFDPRDYPVDLKPASVQ